jgi:hypothetical protein
MKAFIKDLMHILLLSNWGTLFYTTTFSKLVPFLIYGNGKLFEIDMMRRKEKYFTCRENIQFLLEMQSKSQD